MSEITMVQVPLNLLVRVLYALPIGDVRKELRALLPAEAVQAETVSVATYVAEDQSPTQENKTMQIVNPNHAYSDFQMGQLKAAFGDVEVIPAGVNFPSAADGGLTQTAYASAMKYPSGKFLWQPTGLSSGAAAVMATLHGREGSRFPDIAVFGLPKDFPYLGNVNLDVIRHDARPTRFTHAESIPVTGKLLVLGFSHPITDPQKPEIAQLLGCQVSDIEFREGSRQYEYTTVEELIDTVRAQIDFMKISAADWQKTRIVVNLPAHSAGAMIALTEMHGRMGFFPEVLRLELGEDKAYHATEEIDLEIIRHKALREMKESESAERVSAEQAAIQSLLTQFRNAGLHVTNDGNIVKITAANPGEKGFEFEISRIKEITTTAS